MPSRRLNITNSLSRPLPPFVPLLRKYPKLAAALAARDEMYNRQMDEIDRDEADGKLLVIRPPYPLPVRRTEKSRTKLEQAYLIGRRTMEERLSETVLFLRQQPRAAGNNGQAERYEEGSE